jgi:membrane associated rhomboid family serine protease
MRRPPPLQDFIHFPVTGGLCLLAVAVSTANWYGHVDVSSLAMSYWTWHGQPWRLLSCALFHANPVHLLFDVYWTWVFGAIVEEAFGSVFMLGLVVVLQAGSAAGEYAIGIGGVGLSGIGYGLFGFLWTLGRHDRRFVDVIDRTTAWMFVGWFFLCIVLTLTNTAPIANMAHAAGALLGGFFGLMVAFRGPRRYAAGAGLGAALGLLLACSMPTVRPLVNFSKFGGYEEFELGLAALKADQNIVAARFLEQAVAYRHADPAYWYDLGLAYQRLGKYPLAAESFRRAASLQPDSKDSENTIKSGKNS